MKNPVTLDFRATLLTEFREASRAWAAIFCLGGPADGAFVATVCTGFSLYSRPSIALGGWLAFGFHRILEKLSGREHDTRAAMNALLLGLAVGYAFGPGTGFVLLCAAAALHAGLVTPLLSGAFATPGLPVLSIPFATGWILLQIATPSLAGVFGHAYEGLDRLWPELDAALPAGLVAFLSRLGFLVFTPDPVAGALLAGLVAFRSRILLLHGALAFVFCTTLLGLWTGNPGAALATPAGFNFILTGFAVGAVFLLPGPRSLLWSGLACIVCVFLAVALGAFLGRHGSTASTLPFNLAAVAVVALLRRSGSDLIPARHRGTPEETLDEELCGRASAGRDFSIALPFAGTRRVYQAFDGPWTHRGAWRHAYDFVQCGPDGRSHRNDGLDNADYHVFGTDVLAPCAGIVVACRDDLPDNRPGHIDHVNNWGNFVIIRAASGIHVELSHLGQNSLYVKTGDIVNVGRRLARCGNSGYSAYPHLHLQVQSGPWLGDTTLPFNFAGAIYRGRLRLACLPPVGADVAAPVFSEKPSPLAFMLGEVLAVEHRREGVPLGESRWTVKRGADAFGGFYLESRTGDRLGFVVDATGYATTGYTGAPDSSLAVFAAAIPRLPNMPGGVRWRDALPRSLADGRLSRALRTLATAAGVPARFAGLPAHGVRRLDRRGRRLRGRLAGGKTFLVEFDADGSPRRVRAGDDTLVIKTPKP